jgi:hypothetical protein
VQPELVSDDTTALHGVKHRTKSDSNDSARELVPIARFLAAVDTFIYGAVSCVDAIASRAGLHFIILVGG